MTEHDAPLRDESETDPVAYQPEPSPAEREPAKFEENGEVAYHVPRD